MCAPSARNVALGGLGSNQNRIDGFTMPAAVAASLPRVCSMPSAEVFVPFSENCALSLPWSHTGQLSLILMQTICRTLLFAFSVAVSSFLTSLTTCAAPLSHFNYGNLSLLY